MFSRGVMAAFSPEIPEKKLPNPGMAPTAPQYRRSSALACLGPPRTKPSTRTAPFMAPALVPVTPMISIVSSSSSRSSTPHVKAPCDPPPCNAKATLRRCWRFSISALSAFSTDDAATLSPDSHKRQCPSAGSQRSRLTELFAPVRHRPHGGHVEGEVCHMTNANGSNISVEDGVPYAPL